MLGTPRRACPPARGGGNQADPAADALRRSQGGCSTTVPLRAEGHGNPLTIVLTPGERHAAPAFERLMAQGAVTRPGRGRPQLRPRRLVGATGSSSRPIRAYLRRRGIRVTIPRTTNARRTGPVDRVVYRQRTRVERLINRFTQFRRLATR